MRRYINMVVIKEIHTMKKQKEIEFLESLRPARFLKTILNFVRINTKDSDSDIMTNIMHILKKVKVWLCVRAVVGCELHQQCNI